MSKHPWFRALYGAPLCIAAALPAIAQTPSDLASCLAQLQPAAEQAGVTPETWAAQTAHLEPQPALLDKLKSQPEFKLPTWDYLSTLVDDERVRDGQAALVSEAAALQEASFRYGVEPAIVAAVWGVESNFGRNTGVYPIVESLATLSCMGRRQAFFRKELFSALRIVQSGDFAPEVFKGSWAGAFGQTQFMPTTFERLAVDLNGDGKRDLIGDNADALGSTAHFLQRAGWDPALPWGLEVQLPDGYQGPRGRKAKRPLKDWISDGVLTVDGQPLPNLGLPDRAMAGLLEPEAGGPVFVVFRNFDALYSYNASENYALAIAHLADRLKGSGPFSRAWPTDDPGLSRAEKREIQILLITRGHDIGAVDGALGARSRAAIELEQARLAHPVNGRAGQQLLQALRRGE